MFNVVQCNRCRGLLQAVPAQLLDLACPGCGLQAPAEAFRWVGADLEADNAAALARTWNERLARGLDPQEARAFARLAP